MPEEFIHISKKVGDVEKLPPQNIEAEQSVLGALMIDPNSIIKVADLITGQDFYRGSHRKIFGAMIELYQKQEPIDLLSVSSRLKEKELFEETGGMSYLTELTNIVPTASHITHYAKIIRKKKILRDLINASYEIERLGYQETNDIENLLDQVEQKIFQISQGSISQQFNHLKPALNEAFERIDKLNKGGILRGLPTGFKRLDNYLLGMQKSDLIVLASRPALGKTSLALNIARHAAIEEKVPVGIFSLEMSSEQLVDRLIAVEGNIDLWKIRTGHLSKEQNDFTKLGDALHRLAQAPIFVNDSASPNVLQMRTIARRLQAEQGLGLIVVDYLQLIQGRGKNENRVQEVSEISRSLKSLAKELNVPVLALSQLSRAPEHREIGGHRPRLSDLRESGSIEQDADVVLMIYREDMVKKDSEKKNIAEIIIAKHRNGPIGSIELLFHPEKTYFTDIEYAYKEASQEDSFQELL